MTETTYPFGQPIALQPNPQAIAASNLAAFMQRHGVLSYKGLLERARQDVAWFWDAVLKDLDVQFYTPYTAVLEETDDPAFPRWCVGGELNIVHNLLDKWQASEAARNRKALIWEGEDGTVRTYSYGELHAEVCRCASALRSRGIGRGDAVGLFMPMTPELLIAFLAVIKVGGVILPLFSGYGPEAVRTRLEDGGAKALFTADGFFRRGKAVAMKPIADAVLEGLDSLKLVVITRRAGLDVPLWAGRDVTWEDFVAGEPAFAVTERTGAEDPLMLIYTSGTTGKPKGAVHTHCGFPVKGAQDMAHCMDVKPGDVFYWMTDMGWMMGPWLVFGTLLRGATMVFYDGAPDFPEPDRLWALVSRHGVTHLGISPTLIRALMPHGPGPVQRHDLNRLRMVCSTGSPWDPDAWQWCFEHVLGLRKPIINYSGGTEISGGILCGNLFTPLKPGSFSGPVPGMDADVVDATGQPVRGEVGELVIRRPWIGMTRGFWRDEERYRQSYWSQIPGLWVHGDFAAIDEDGLWYILGRSDDTIKVAGKRLGPSEVEAVVNAHAAVRESVAVGVPDPVKGEDVVVFAILHDPDTADDALKKAMLDAVAAALGKPLRPRELRFTTAIPKTRNAKVLRRLIRQAYLGEALGDTSSLEDPAAVEAIRQAR
jgi:acetyl-CoA synthetase